MSDKKSSNKIFVILLFLAIFLSISYVSAESNASLQTKSNLAKAQKCIDEMIALKIPTSRVNETFQETAQLYGAQSSLENQQKKADYTLINENTLEICKVKETAIKAQDELNIFNEKYLLTSKETNLSSIEQDYKEIQKSFEEERFEDTLQLIQKGYGFLSEVEASQTAVKLFYKTTTTTVKTFLIENWKKILIIALAVVILLIAFWRTIRRLRIKMKLYNLEMKEKSVNQLIKKMQYDYFEKKTLSETEFKVKMEKFKNIIRDIKRQVPALKEQLIKIETAPKFKKAKVYISK